MPDQGQSPKNTNNSLNDLANEGFGFNTYLENENNQNAKSQFDGVVAIQNEILLLQRNRGGASVDDIKKIDKKIAELQQELVNLRENGDTFVQQNSWGEDGKSMFDRTAYIDYGRIYNRDNNWEHYNKKEEGGTEFKRNNNNPLNEPILGDANLPADEGLSPRHLIEWSEQYPALQLRGQDFAYCKNLGIYPNNRMVILRRFKNGIPDNLFNYYNQGTLNSVEFLQPLSTMINWIKPNEDFLKLSFNEKWEAFDGSLLKALGGNSDGKGEKNEHGKTTGGPTLANGMISLLLDGAGAGDDEMQREDGLSYLDKEFSGNPDLIKNSMKRKTGGGGLNSKIDFKLKFDYEMRYINNIDPGVAMLDLISNCLRMGTSTSYFRFAIPKIKNSEIVKKAITGNFTLAFEKIEKKLNSFVEEIGKSFIDFANNKITEALEQTTVSAVEKGLKFLISKYREQLKAALAAETGLPSGIWHVTIGNPKNPIISCGDLVLIDSTLKLGNELGFNDFPNEFSVEYQLKTARERGRDEIEAIMNAGKGRVFTYLETSNNPDYDIYKPETNKEPTTKN